MGIRNRWVLLKLLRRYSQTLGHPSRIQGYPWRETSNWSVCSRYKWKKLQGSTLNFLSFLRESSLVKYRKRNCFGMQPGCVHIHVLMLLRRKGVVKNRIVMNCVSDIELRWCSADPYTNKPRISEKRLFCLDPFGGKAFSALPGPRLPVP